MSEAQAGPLEWRQRAGDRLEATQVHLDGRQAQIHTSMPGHIVSFDPATMTAVVQPGLQAMHRQTDGSRAPMTISEIHDVPVQFPGGGGYTLTFPVKPGDECLIVFNERSIDNWHQHGGVQTPSDQRMHDINDAVAMVGLRSQPKVIPGFDPTRTQMRSDNGALSVSLDEAGGIVEIVAPTEIRLIAPLVTVSQTLRAGDDVFARTVSLHQHIHGNVQGGGGTSGVPVP